MSYNSIVAMANSYDLQQRIKACACTQTGPANPPANFTDKAVALVQTDGAKWELSASPGWAAAWDSAVAANNLKPGYDPAVITDAMILSAVQPFVNAKVV